MSRGARPAGFKEEPGASLGFVDPNLEQAGGGDIVMFVAKLVRFPHPPRQLAVVLAQLRQHIERLDVFRVVVFDPLHPAYLARRTQGRTTDFADALGHRIGHGKELVGLLVEEEMVIAKMRPAHVPVEIFRLHVDREDVGEERIHRSGNFRGCLRGKIRWRTKRRCESAPRGGGVI